MKVLDSAAVIDIFNENVSEETARFMLEDSVITDHVLYEMLQGTILAKNYSEQKKVRFFDFCNSISSLPFTKEAARKSAQISAHLQAKGQEIEDVDCLIAGTALANNVTTIITRNKKHFERIPGLKVETY